MKNKDFIALLTRQADRIVRNITQPNSCTRIIQRNSILCFARNHGFTPTNEWTDITRGFVKVWEGIGRPRYFMSTQDMIHWHNSIASSSEMKSYGMLVESVKIQLDKNSEDGFKVQSNLVNFV